MKSNSRFRFSGAFATVLLLWAGFAPVHASDHADPLVLNPLKPPKMSEPRITDLHVFLDSDQDPRIKEPTALVFDLCVFPAIPALQPHQSGPGQTVTLPQPGQNGTAQYQLPKLNLDGYTYRVFMDLNAKLSFDDHHGLGDLVRYGGSFLDPANIFPEVTFEFTLNNDASLKSCRITGLYSPSDEPVAGGPLQPGKINVRAGVYDDPFIFPRFFRTNVVGIVVSIPLNRLPRNQRNFVMWGTTSKDGKQIDHVGRSQRTQLPRFDYLNTLPPSEHVAAINKHHTDPPAAWDFMRTLLSPLFGRRPYDAVPDVLVYTRDRKTEFPNGRKLADDVAGIIARSGDTQLWEVAYADDPRYPRVTTNDGVYELKDGQPIEFDSWTGQEIQYDAAKRERFVIEPSTKQRMVIDPNSPRLTYKERPLKPYGSDFPYLASAWTQDEVMVAPLPFQRSGPPNLTDSTWRKLFFVELVPIVALLLALFWALPVKAVRIGIVVLGVVAVWLLWAVYATNRMGMDLMDQPAMKLSRLVFGLVLIVILTLVLVFALGRRHGLAAYSSIPPTDGDGAETASEKETAAALPAQAS